MYYAELNVPKNHVYLFKPHAQERSPDLKRELWYNIGRTSDEG